VSLFLGNGFLSVWGLKLTDAQEDPVDYVWPEILKKIHGAPLQRPQQTRFSVSSIAYYFLL